MALTRWRNSGAPCAFTVTHRQMSMPRPMYKYMSDMNYDNFAKRAWDGDVLFHLSSEVPHGFTMDS